MAVPGSGHRPRQELPDDASRIVEAATDFLKRYQNWIIIGLTLIVLAVVAFFWLRSRHRERLDDARFFAFDPSVPIPELERAAEDFREVEPECYYILFNLARRYLARSSEPESLRKARGCLEEIVEHDVGMRADLAKQLLHTVQHNLDVYEKGKLFAFADLPEPVRVPGVGPPYPEEARSYGPFPLWEVPMEQEGGE